MAKKDTDQVVGDHERGKAYVEAVDLITEGKVDEGKKALSALASGDSPLAAKAAMRLADLHREARDFEAAEGLLRERCLAILSAERRERVARIYLDLARKATRVDEENSHGLGKGPDWEKGLRLLDALCRLDLPTGIREEAFAERASIAFEAQNWARALQGWAAYLQAFDPDYRRELLAMAPALASSVELGERRFEGRLAMAEAALRSHGIWPDPKDPAGGVNGSGSVEDTILVLLESTKELLSKDDCPLSPSDRKAKLARLAYLLPLAAGLAGEFAPDGEGPRSPGACRRAVAMARSFREEHGASFYGRAMALAFLEAQALLMAGYGDESEEAFKALAAGGVVPPSNDADRRLEGACEGEARFAVAELQRYQARHVEAQASYEAYLAAHPDGRHWHGAQSGVYGCIAARGALAAAEGDFEAAREFWTDLANRRGLASEGAWTVLATACLHEVEARGFDEAGKPGKALAARRKAIEDYGAVSRRFPGACGSLAHELRGNVLRHHMNDLAGAVAAYRAAGTSAANQAIAELGAMELRLVSPKVFPSGEQPHVKLEGRNLKKLRLRRYAVDLRDFFERYGTSDGVDRLDLDLVSPDACWELEPDESRPYHEQHQEIPIDAEGPGAWAVSVEAEDHVATVLVLSSDLDLIMASTVHEAVALLRRDGGKTAVSGAEVRMRVGSGATKSVTLTSDASGLARGRFDEQLAEAPRVLAVWGEHVAVANMDLPSSAVVHLENRGYLHCPRNVYRPGERVDCMGWIRTGAEEARGKAPSSPKTGEAVEAGAVYEISLSAPDGRTLHEEKVTLDAFGAFSLSFPTSEDAPLGDYTITASHVERGAWSFATSFELRWIRPPKVDLTMRCEPAAALPGDEVTVSLRAAYTTGAPLARRPVELQLPDGRRITLLTDETGDCSTVLDSRPYFRRASLFFRASLPGEDVETSLVCPLLPAAVDCRIILPPAPHRVGETIPLELRSLAPDGKPLPGTPMRVTVRGRGTARPLALPSEVVANAALAGVMPDGDEEIVLLDESLVTDEGGRLRLPVVVEGAGTARLSVIATDERGRERAFHRSFEVETAPSRRMAIEVDEASLTVGARCEGRIRCDEDARLGLLVFTTDELLEARVHRFAEGKSDFAFDVTSAHAPDCRLVALAAGRKELLRAEQAFTVRRVLSLELDLPEDPVGPGAPFTVGLRVRDELGRPVKGQLSLSMVDAALLKRYPDEAPDLVGFFAEGLHRSVELTGCTSTLFRRVGEKKGIDAALLAEEKRLQLANLAEDKKDAREGRMRRESPKRKSAKGFSGASAKLMAMAPPPPPAVDGLFCRDDAFGAYDMEAEEVCCETPCPSKAPGFGIGGGGRGLMPPEPKPQPAAREEEAIGSLWMAPIVTDETGEATVELEAPRRCTAYTVRVRAMTADTLVADEKAELVVRKDVYVDLVAPERLMEGDEIRLPVQVHCAADLHGEATIGLTFRSPGRTVAHALSVALDGPGAVVLHAPAHVAPPAGPLTVEARLSVGGEPVDALRREVEILPWGRVCVDGASGTATDDVTVSLSLPESVRPETARLSLRVHGPDDDALLAAFERRSFFSGGTESAAVRALALCALLEGAGDRTDGGLARRDMLRRELRGSLSRIIATQNGDGSWSWIVPCRGRSLDGSTDSTAWALAALAAGGRVGLVSDPAPRDRALAHLRQQAGQLEGDSLARCLHAMAAAGSGDAVALENLAKKGDRLGVEGQALLALSFLLLGREASARGAGEALEARLAAAESDGAPLPLRARALALMALQRLSLAPRRLAPMRRALDGALADRWNFGADRAFCLWALATLRPPADSGEATWTVTVSVGEKTLGEIASTARGADASFLLHGEEIPNLADCPVRLAYKGRGSYSWSAALEAFSPELPARKGLAEWGLHAERCYASPRLHHGKALEKSSMLVDDVAMVDHVEDELVTTGRPSDHEGVEAGPLMLVTRWLPAGCRLDEESVPDDAIWWQVDRNRLDMVFRGRPSAGHRLRLLPTCPGTFRRLPAEASPTWAPGRGDRLAEEKRLVVRADGDGTRPDYRWSESEHLAWGLALFEEGDGAGALVHLDALSAELKERRREVVRALLWIRCEDEHFEAAAVASLFETLSKRWPKVVLPYEKLVAIGKAYGELGRHEAACALWRATMSATWRDDLPVAAELEEAGEFMRAVAYVEDLFWEYPDLPVVAEGLFCLAQDMLANQERANVVGESVAEDLVERAVHRLEDFLHFFGDLPYAPEAWMSLLGALRVLELHEHCFSRAHAAVEAWPEHELSDRYRFFAALSAFELRRYEEAVTACRNVAEADGPDGETATYLLGQMHHALGRPAEAIAAYREVRDSFDDARLALDYLERRRLDLPELRITRPDVPAKIELAYVNLSSVRLQAYRVDLMRLFLKERNLEGIAEVETAGLRPTFLLEKELPPVAAGRTGTVEIELPLAEHGAYLVLARSEGAFASGLVLVSPLSMELQRFEDAVRATVFEEPAGTPAREVHVKASDGDEFKSGATDLRGAVTLALDSSDGVTVVARRGEDDYAFFRVRAEEEPGEDLSVDWDELGSLRYDASLADTVTEIAGQASQRLRGFYGRRSAADRGVPAGATLES